MQRVRKGMTQMQGSGDIRRRKRNDEFPRGIGGVTRLGVKETTLLPPGVPRRLDSLRVVGLEVKGIEGLDHLLLAGLGRILVGRQGFDSLFGFLLLLLRLGFTGILLLLLLLFGCKLGGFFGAGLLICL